MTKTSLQTITWGDPQHDRFDEIFSLAKANGFTGLEIGFRRLREVPVADINKLLQLHDLQINASHIGGNLGDYGQAENERADLEAAINYLEKLRIPYLLYSGLIEQEDDALNHAIDQLNHFADRCSDHGIYLLFHNHDWEFKNNQRIWNRIRENRSSSLGFALDLGWAAKAGQSPGAVLESLAGDIKILHFKDFISAESGQNTCHLGEGIIDFSSAWDWLSLNANNDLWITAEQDNADDATQACVANGAYLNDQLFRCGIA